MQNYRRSDYDVTNTVRVSSPADVLSVVSTLLEETYPGESFTQIQRAFRDFELLFTGQREGYLGCDTVYHDTQHTLDMTLAMARLIAGYERVSHGRLFAPPFWPRPADPNPARQQRFAILLRAAGASGEVPRTHRTGFCAL